MRIDFKKIGRQLTSPTAWSWYGIIGVGVTMVLTYISTNKADIWKATCTEKLKNETLYKTQVPIPDEKPKTWDDKWKEYLQALKNRPMKEKLKEAAGLALIFIPPFAAAAGTCYCIYHGNAKAMQSVGTLMEANNFLSGKFVNNKAAAAAGMAVGSQYSRHKQWEDEDDNVSSGKLFSNDPAEVEDYGKAVLFYDEFTQREYESTILGTVMAEREVHKFFNLRGWVAVGEFEEFQGLEPLQWTYQCGWSDSIGFKRGYSWVDFKHVREVLPDGRVRYRIQYGIEPVFTEEFEWIMPDPEEY